MAHLPLPFWQVLNAGSLGWIPADFDNGLLTVRLPKAEEAVSRKIEVIRRS